MKLNIFYLKWQEFTRIHSSLFSSFFKLYFSTHAVTEYYFTGKSVWDQLLRLSYSILYKSEISSHLFYKRYSNHRPSMYACSTKPGLA